MKRVLTPLIVLALSILLTGCVKFDLSLEINKDSTISGSMIYAISDSLAEFGSDLATDDPTDSLVDLTVPGVTTSDYKEGGFTGTIVKLDRVPLSAFNQPGNETGGFKVIKSGNQISLEGELDLSSAGPGDESGSDWGDALAKSLFASADLNIRVKFPVKVLTSTGVISEDGRTVTWKPVLGEKIDLATTVELPTANLIRLGLAGIAALLILAAGIAIGLKRKRKSEPTLVAEDLTEN